DILPWRIRCRRTPVARAAALRPAECRCEPNLRRTLPCGIGAPHSFRFPCESAAELSAARNAAGSTTSYFLRRRAQDLGDHVRHAIPLFGFRLESAFARGGESVIFR